MPKRRSVWRAPYSGAAALEHELHARQQTMPPSSEDRSSVAASPEKEARLEQPATVLTILGRPLLSREIVDVQDFLAQPNSIHVVTDLKKPAAFVHIASGLLASLARGRFLRFSSDEGATEKSDYSPVSLEDVQDKIFQHALFDRTAANSSFELSYTVPFPSRRASQLYKVGIKVQDLPSSEVTETQKYLLFSEISAIEDLTRSRQNFRQPASVPEYFIPLATIALRDNLSPDNIARYLNGIKGNVAERLPERLVLGDLQLIQQHIEVAPTPS